MESLLTIGTFVAFTALVAVMTWLMTRGDNHATGTGFFLAGRSLTAPFIAGSLLLTNLSTEQMVGLNGAAFIDGLCVMVWEVLAVIALVAMALYFLPRFLKSGIATVPQYLHERFDARTRTITDLIFLLAYAVILLPIVLYSGAAGLTKILDVKGLLGFESDTVMLLGAAVSTDTVVLWLTVWFIGLIGACYALIGGLRTVAVSDTLNGVGLLVGGLMITGFGLAAIGARQGDGGIVTGLEIMRVQQAARLNSIGGQHSSVPFSTVFTGIILLNLFYWCTNQQIIQRTFAARSLKEGQKGVLLCGALKLVGPLYLVVPGLIAYQLYADRELKPDLAYGTLVNDVLPWPLIGFFAAAMTGAILSSFNSVLNSTTTIYSYGIYKTFLRRDATDHQLVRSGRLTGWIIAGLAMLIAPWLAQTTSIFAYIQKMNGLYFIPIFAVVLMGMVSRRTPAVAANVALIVGLAAIACGYFVPLGMRVTDGVTSKTYLAPDYLHEFHFLGLVFVILIALMAAIRLISPLPDRWMQRDSGDVDLTPWRWVRWCGAGMCAVVVLIYLTFAGGLG